MNRKQLNNIRDCVNLCLEKGARDKHEFMYMRYGIICELKRLGYEIYEITNIMDDWNDKSYKALNRKDFAQKVENFIKWVFEKDGKAGCGYFEEYCILNCIWKEKRRKEFNRKSAEEPVISQDDIERFLNKDEGIKHPRDCATVWKVIDIDRVKKGLLRKDTVFISCQGIAKGLQERGYKNANKMLANRLAKELTDTPLLEIVVKGKKGTFFGLANGYKLKTPKELD